MRSRRRGFTLLELLVVLALIALTTGLVAPMASRWLDAAAERGWRAELAADLAALPVRAFRAGADLEVTAQELRAGLASAPADLGLELAAPLRYGPTGLAAGGQLTILRGGLPAERWRIEAVTGEPRSAADDARR